MKHTLTSIALCLLSLPACLYVQDERGHVEEAPPLANQSEPAPTELTVQPKTAPQEQTEAEAQTATAEARSPLRCTFEGQRFLDPAKLNAALQYELDAWLEGTPVEVVADDCAYQLVQHYRGLGFSEAEVLVVPGLDEEGSLLSFTIKEGAQTLVGEFAFPGSVDSNGLSAPDLQQIYSTRDQPVWIRRDQARLADKIVARYLAAGFLDANAGPTSSRELPERGSEFERFFRLETPVVPGLRYTLIGVEHNLPEPLASELELENALESVAPKSNVPFEPHWLPRWTRIVDGTLTGAGFLDAKVQANVELDKDQGQALVRLNIQPGQRIKLSSIRYPAELKVRQGFLNRQIGLQPGDPISALAVDEALSNLYRTGLFRTVRLQVEGSGDKRDLVVELEEWPTRETFIEPGYGSFEGARLRVGWRHHNVLGVARTLRVEGVVAENASRALIGWNDPWTLSNGWVLDVNTDVSQRKLPAFRRNSSTAGAFASRDFGDFDRWTVHTGLRFEEIRLRDVRVELLPGSGFEEDLSITTLEAGLAFDNRNHPLLPSKGQRGHFTVQQTVNASGAANAFAKVLSGWSYYHPLSESRTLSVGARAVAVFPRDGDPHPLGLRLFSGGDNSVRSFREAELGPLDANGTPVGGEATSTFSIELNQRLGASQFHAAAFVDVGNVVSSASDLFAFEDMETALGVGVRYVLPIGPLRLDWAHNPNAKEFQDDWVLHFSVGVAF